MVCGLATLSAAGLVVDMVAGRGLEMNLMVGGVPTLSGPWHLYTLLASVGVGAAAAVLVGAAVAMGGANTWLLRANQSVE